MQLITLTIIQLQYPKRLLNQREKWGLGFKPYT